MFSAASIYYEKDKFYDEFLIPIAQLLDAEWTHKLTIWWLKYGLIPTARHVDTPLLVSYYKHYQRGLIVMLIFLAD